MCLRYSAINLNPSATRHRLVRMNCNVFTVLHLRANGQFSCGCDTGHEINLGAASAQGDWTVQGLFASRGYSLVRAMFRRGYAPWGGICTRCVAYQPDAPFAYDRPAKRIKQVQFEPSFACALRCPSCPRAELAPSRPGPVFLSLAVWRRVLQSLHDEHYEVGGFLTTGLGDPLTHPQLEDFIETIREYFPTAPITVNTNANYRLADVFPRGSYPDRLLVSVDGLNQRSYEQYRINGDVATALEFMRDARRVSGRRPAVEWKYILFRHNDSDEELIAAQRKAEELDVDSLQFVFTHTKEKSLRYSPANVDDLPIVWRGTYPEGTCHLRFRRTEPTALTPNDSDAQRGSSPARRARIQVDSVQRWAGRLIVRGWAMGTDGSRPRRMLVQPDNDPPVEARIGLVREDVWQAYPALENRTSGFDAMVALPISLSGAQLEITVTYESNHGDPIRFSVTYDLGPAVRRACQSPAALHLPQG